MCPHTLCFMHVCDLKFFFLFTDDPDDSDPGVVIFLNTNTVLDQIIRLPGSPITSKLQTGRIKGILAY